MKKEVIKKTIEINAPKEKIWQVLLHDKYTRIWYSEFGEGLHAATDWKVGSKVVITDHTGSGPVGKVVVHRPNEVISVEYEGFVISGIEDYEGEAAKQVKGGRETYRLSEKDGGLHLAIDCDMGEAFFDTMSLAWEKALKKIRELSEGLNS